MTVGWILRDKGRGVVTALPDTPLLDVIKLLSDKKIGAIVVVDGARKIQGIISERDVVTTLAEKGAAALDMPVSAFMTRSVVTCSEHHSVDWAMGEMTAHRFRHIPVVDRGGLNGIISIGDVVKYKLAMAEAEAAQMREYIATG